MIYAKGREFILDDESDLDDLPTNRTPGSVAKVLSTSAYYQLNSQGEWIKQEISSGSSSGTSSSSDDIYVSSAYLDDDDNLILGFSTDELDPLSVDFSDVTVNSEEVSALIEEAVASTVEEVSESYIDSLFE